MNAAAYVTNDRILETISWKVSKNWEYNKRDYVLTDTHTLTL